MDDNRQIDTRRQQIIDWFATPKAKMSPKSLAWAGLILLFGLILLANKSLLGLFLLAGAGGWLFFQYSQYQKAKEKYEARPTLSQMLAWLMEDLRRVGADGLRRCGANPKNLATDMLLTYRPTNWTDREASGLDPVLRRVRRGVNEDDDAPFLFACWHLTAVMIESATCAVFDCDYNWLTDSAVGRSARQFQVQHVSSLRWAEFSEQRKDGGLLTLGEHVYGQALELILRGGEKIEIKISENTYRSCNDEDIKSHGETVTVALRNLALTAGRMDQSTSSGAHFNAAAY